METFCCYSVNQTKPHVNLIGIIFNYGNFRQVFGRMEISFNSMVRLGVLLFSAEVMLRSTLLGFVLEAQKSTT